MSVAWQDEKYVDAVQSVQYNTPAMNRQPDLTRALERIAEIRRCPCFTPRRLLADELGVTLTAIALWEKRGMPLLRAYEIQSLTGVPVKELLPNFTPFQETTDA